MTDNETRLCIVGSPREVQFFHAMRAAGDLFEKDGRRYVVTTILEMADTPLRVVPNWSIRGVPTPS